MSKLSFMEKLLDGVEVEWKALGKVANIKNGKDWKKLGAGDIPVYGSGGIMGYVDTCAMTNPQYLFQEKDLLPISFMLKHLFGMLIQFITQILTPTKSYLSTFIIL